MKMKNSEIKHVISYRSRVTVIIWRNKALG